MQNKEKLVLLIDLVVICFAYVLALWIHTGHIRIDAFGEHVLLYPILIANYGLFMIWFRLHQALSALPSVDEGIVVFRINLSATFVLLLLKAVQAPLISMSYSVILMSLFIVVLLMEGVHFIHRAVCTFPYRFNRHNQNTLIYGAGKGARLLLTDLLHKKHHPYRIVGLVDDDHSLKGLRVHGFPVLGYYEQLKTIIKSYDICHVIIAIPSLSHGQRQKIVDGILDAGVADISMMTSLKLKDPSQIHLEVRKINIADLLNRKEITLDLDYVSESIVNQTVLVTGAGGSIGSELVRQIVKSGPKHVVLFDINESGLYAIEQELRFAQQKEVNNKPLAFTAVVGSICDQSVVNALFHQQRFDLVFHAAAHKHVPLMENTPYEAIKNNVLGSKNIIDASMRFGVKAFVNISTDKAVNPTNVMGATKRFIEMMIQSERCMKSQTKFVAVRFGNVLGSNGSVIPLFYKQIEQGGPVTVTDPNIVRYFMTIPEAVSLVLQASTMAQGGEIFVLDMGEQVNITELARKMIRLAGFEPEKDIGIHFIGLRPGEKLFEELLVQKEAMRKTKNDLIFVEPPVVWKDSHINRHLHQFYQLPANTDPQYIKQKLQEAVSTYTIDMGLKGGTTLDL